jgi:hypothetical protein
MNKRT